MTTNVLKNDVKKKWLKALRSKRYRQGEGDLYDSWLEGPPRYCCLGVLCVTQRKYPWKDMDSYTLLPKYVIEQAVKRGVDVDKNDNILVVNNEESINSSIVECEQKLGIKVTSDNKNFEYDFVIFLKDLPSELKKEIKAREIYENNTTNLVQKHKGKNVVRLSVLNDRGLPFEFIANCIEYGL